MEERGGGPGLFFFWGGLESRNQRINVYQFVFFRSSSLGMYKVYKVVNKRMFIGKQNTEKKELDDVTDAWQFCWCPFWDGENLTLLNGCW